MNLRIKTEPVLAGADATVLYRVHVGLSGIWTQVLSNLTEYSGAVKPAAANTIAANTAPGKIA